MAELPPGTRVGGYRILSTLGKGGMGVVYEAEDAKRGRRVALKVVSRELAASDDFVARFRRERRALSAVSHENVVAFFESGEDHGTSFLVSELLPGGTLEDLIRERGRLEWREAASLAAGIARGLSAVHERGLVHRDLKPQNVLLTSSRPGETPGPKITDFGLVGAHTASLAVSHALTRTGELVGTLAYMAPEQANAAGAVTASADLYSLGALLYTLLTGSPPFQGEGYSLVKKHLVEKPRSPRESAPGIPASLERLVLSLLEKKPASRPAGAREVALELDAILETARERPEAPPRGEAAARRLSWRVAALGAVGLALACAGGGWAFVASRLAEARSLAEDAARKNDEKHYREASALASRALEIDPANVAALKSRAEARWKTDDLDGAIADLTAAIELAPRDARAHVNRGGARSRKGDDAGALADMTRAIELDPGDSFAWINRGALLDRKGDQQGAIADFTKAIELDPASALALCRRGTAYARARITLDRAIDDLTRAIGLDPNAASAWRERGAARSRKHEIDLALADVTRAIELDPRDADAWSDRSAVRAQARDLAGAIADTSRAIDLAPGAARHWHHRALAHAQAGDLARAGPDLERAVELEPRNAEMWADLGAIRGSAGDHQGSFVALTRAVEIDPRDAHAWRSRGTAAACAGDNDRAIADLTRSIELEPRDGTAFRLRAVAKEAKGDREGAIADLERSIELSAGYPEEARLARAE
ncbi:tetratricopeptide repeat protein, partial [bacterium]|nr:tetratricopeptide repeat protein [bacterium]